MRCQEAIVVRKVLQGQVSLTWIHVCSAFDGRIR